MFFLPCSTSTAPSSYAGATITSVKTSATCSASCFDTGRLTAMTPPKAETGSHSCAFRCASRHVVADRDPTRVGMLDDRDRGQVEVVRRPPRRVGVDVVVVGHLLAVQLLRRGQPPAPVPVESRRLVRVLAVPQHGGSLPGRARPGREAGPVGGVGQHAAHPRRHRHVVRRRVGERLGRQPLALVEREPALGDRAQHVRIARRRGHDRHRRVVLGRGPHHRRPADVDLLHALVRRRAGGDRLGERVEVRHDEVERLDLEVGQLLDVGVEAAIRQDARVHAGVQGLDPAVETLGEAGQVLDPGDRAFRASRS